MAGLSILSRLAVVVGMIAVLSPCAMAQTARTGRGPVKIKYTPVKASFKGTSVAFVSGVRLESRARVTPVSGRNGVAVKAFTMPKTTFVKEASLRPINLTRKFNSSKSSYTQARGSIKKSASVKFVKSAPIRR